MSVERAARIAARLADDWWARTPYQTLTGDDAPADMPEAYAIQAALQPLLAERRGPIAGRKIALSSKAMQQMVGIDQPVAGAFFRDDIHQSPAQVEVSGFRHMGLECEMAFQMARDVAPGTAHSAETVQDLIDEIRPAFELIEDKDADYAAIDALTLIADNAWCGGVVLGTPLEDWRGGDLNTLVAVLHQEGEPPEATEAGASDPLGSLAWVLNHFGGRGERVQAGEWVISGSVLRTRFPVAGDLFRFEIGGQAVVEMSVR